MLGIINAQLVSKGRYGRTKQITVGFPSSMIKKIKKILHQELEIS